jgi:hypothetical protein
MNYESAGCLFHDENTFLAGFQRKQQRWTSFGGKKYHGETAFSTAMREVVEEVFEIRMTQKTIANLICTIPLSIPTQDGSYIYYKYPYRILFTIAELLEYEGYQSPLYDVWPTTLSELIEKRKSCSECEIEKIQLFSAKEIHDMRLAFDKFFLLDLTKLFLGGCEEVV